MATTKKEDKMALRITYLIALIAIIPMAVYAQTETTEEKAINAILTAKEDLQDMMDSGIHIPLAHDTILEAEKELYGENYTQLLIEAERINETEKKAQIKKIIQALQESISKRRIDYNLVIEKAAQVREIKERAYDIKYQLTSLKLRMDSLQQINLSAEYGMYKEAESLFNDGMYDAAEEKIKETFSAVNTREAEETGIRLLYKASRDNIINYVTDNWKKLLITSTIIAIVGILTLWQGLIYSLRRRINRLELEEKVITDLIKESQKERFVKGTITTEEYRIRIEGYENRIIDIDKELPVLKDRLRKNQTPGIHVVYWAFNKVSSKFVRIRSWIQEKLPKKKAPHIAKTNIREIFTPVIEHKRPSLIAKVRNALNKIRSKIADRKMHATINKLTKAGTTQQGPKSKRRKFLWPVAKWHLPKIKLPKIRLPKLRIGTLPKIKLPKLQLPKFKLRTIKLPRFRLPRVHLPRIKLPKINPLRVRLPRFRLPNLRLPRSLRIQPEKLPGKEERPKLPQLKLPKLPKTAIANKRIGTKGALENMKKKVAVILEKINLKHAINKSRTFASLEKQIKHIPTKIKQTLKRAMK